MKNKKLFAILTLVCFMFTLMPVAAFAAAPGGPADPQTSYIFTDEENVTANVDENVEVGFQIKDSNITTASAATLYVWAMEDGQNVPTTALKSVAVATVANGSSIATAGTDGGDFAGTVYKLTGVETGDAIHMKFGRSGNFKVYASFDAPSTNSSSTPAAKIANVEKLKTIKEQQSIVVNADAASSAKYYTTLTTSGSVQSLTYADPGATDHAGNVEPSVPAGTTYNGGHLHSGAAVSNFVVAADNVASEKISLNFKNNRHVEVSGQTVKISTSSSNLTVDSETLKTNALGNVEFKVTGSREGIYKVYVSCGAYDLTINVKVGSTAAAYVKTTKEPTGPIDVDKTNLEKVVRFTMSDINGNLVTPQQARTIDGGAAHAFGMPNSNRLWDNNATVNGGKENSGYVAIVSQPSASNLKNSDIKLIPDTTDNAGVVTSTLDFGGKTLKAEGTYEFKVVLDNGNYTTVKLEVKEFTTPVELILEYPAPSVVLGGTINVKDLLYKDANGVTKDASPYVTVAGNGYAIQNLVTQDSKTKGAVTIKSDEKYVGTTVTITAVDERYNLTASQTLTVADEATALSFSTKTAEVNVNNSITVSLVDGQGNRVALGNNATNGVEVDSITYVILEKPADAKVSAITASTDNNLLSSGTFKMNLTSDKIGNVKVQAIVKITERDTTNATNQAVTKYYTGTQTFAVGTGETGNVVVMSIGSNEVIVNDSVKTIDAQPVIQNNRTFVPFRALAEAFGAKVAYDETTQAVTAELNGVTVVLTVGSPTYTVNGEEKTADVAPYISGSRTMVPVRFAAEAFGIKVTPTYDENGATADILFNL